MNKINWQKEFEKTVASLDGSKKLLLHSCCAPCSSYCLISLLKYFDITCFYYNPNITDEGEYKKRVAELHRLVSLINEEYGSDVKIIDGDYEPDRFIKSVRDNDLALSPEGGKRCEMCFGMRLGKTYEVARQKGFTYFTTTLTISPHKDAQLINSTGTAIARSSGEDGPIWLPSDFKKNDGYRQSIELSKKYDLYRQNYCGCEFSR